MENEYYPFVNLPLPYAYDALEPYIDAKTMQLHHDRHLGTYIRNLNALLERYPRLRRLSLEQFTRGVPGIPPEDQTALRNNAGGVYNHRFFFDGLTEPSFSEPSDSFVALIERDFGSWERFREEFDKAAMSVFGSGYAWLVSDRGRLKIMTTPNQNTPLGRGVYPVLAIDVWEHAYYLKHYNVRADYINDWWAVVDWDRAEERYRNMGR